MAEMIDMQERYDTGRILSYFSKSLWEFQNKPHIRKLDTGSWAWYETRIRVCPMFVAPTIYGLTMALARTGRLRK